MKGLTFDETRDFPYYNNNPRIPKIGWIILLLAVPISFLLYMIIGLSSEFLGSIVFCFVMLIPLLYFSNWNYKLLFQKPDRNEIILALLMFAGYMIYATVMGSVLDMFHLAGSGIANDTTVNLESIVSLIFSMMGEELLKFIPLMFFMRLIYKFTGNRKLSLIISIIIVLTCFGLIHYDPATSTILSVLLIQGLGSIFEVYGYIKTKNLFVPYISHLLTDATVFLIILLGIT